MDFCQKKFTLSTYNILEGPGAHYEVVLPPPTLKVQKSITPIPNLVISDN